MTPKQYKKLRDVWYKKLEREGFKEIEDVNSPREMLVQWHSTHFKCKYNPITFSEKEEYFQRATDMLHTFAFKNELEKKIWELHANGASGPDISKTLKIGYDKAKKTITRLRKNISTRF